jgi:hypothetical protein
LVRSGIEDLGDRVSRRNRKGESADTQCAPTFIVTGHS